MLMLQSMKAHAAVSLLAQHGLLEDTATIARRILELSVQAVFIGAESDKQIQRRRAGSYCAFLWRQLPGHIKHRLPESARRTWIGLGKGYGRWVQKGAKRWGPSFFDMFKEIGREDLYRTDYALLSSIAHGANDHQVFQFSEQSIRLHSREFVPILLVYSTRYFLATTGPWADLFGVLDDDDQERLTSLVLEWEYQAKEP